MMYGVAYEPAPGADALEITNAAGRVLLLIGPRMLRLHAEAARQQGAARYYAETVYIERPRTREQWRAVADVRDVMRAEVAYRPFFA